jgi:heat shock protein HslJ
MIMKRGTTKRAITATVLALALVACSQRPTSESPNDAPSVSANAAQLQGTYWKLTALGTNPVNAPESQREPHIVLQADSKVNGSGGCNRMFGSYELNGEALAFSGVGSTKMACQDAMEIETAFLPALQRVAKYRITGQQLELLDSAGVLVARFDAKSK